MTRTRRDVWAVTREEGDWPAVLVAYERAVTELRALDPSSGPPTNPMGWAFLAAIHGRARPNGQADTSHPMWSNCQHSSWFFFPWHRMYLRAFELIVQHVLEDEDWSLPYWYSVDPDDPGSAVLPPAFRDTTTGNDLFTTRRSTVANDGRPLLFLDVLTSELLSALRSDEFSSDDGTGTFGGGQRDKPAMDGDELGLLEGVPHGAVHVVVGNDLDAQGRTVRAGWMGNPFFAALDPIFWLHHANVDRLWDVWLKLDPQHANPDDDTWLDTAFSFPAPDGGEHTWTVREVLDTEALGYRYESTDAPSAVAPPEPADGFERLTITGDAGGREPQTLGAVADVAIETAGPVDVDLEEPAGFEALDAVGPQRVYLRIEGITGTAAAALYSVYVNVPDGASPEDHPELRAGAFSTFRLAEASAVDDRHDGSGLTAVFEITAVRDALAAEGRWDPGRVRLSFVPATPSGEEVDAAGLESMEAPPSDITARRVAVIAR